MSTPPVDSTYTNLLEIDTFQVVKDMDFPNASQRGRNNSTEHWISHMCDDYKSNKDTIEGQEENITGVFSSDEILEGACYYCHIKIPEAITALWSLLEWETAGEILHNDPLRKDLYNVTRDDLYKAV